MTLKINARGETTPSSKLNACRRHRRRRRRGGGGGGDDLAGSPGPAAITEEVAGLTFDRAHSRAGWDHKNVPDKMS